MMYSFSMCKDMETSFSVCSARVHWLMTASKTERGCGISDGVKGPKMLEINEAH